MGTGGHGDQRTRNFERRIFFAKIDRIIENNDGKIFCSKQKVYRGKNQIKKIPTNTKAKARRLG